MYLPLDASKRRIKEAENARNNRWEIVKALSQGQINRRDLFKWGLFTSAGLLLAKNGLSPYAKSAFAQVPTGVPRSPVGSALPYTQPLESAPLCATDALDQSRAAERRVGGGLAQRRRSDREAAFLAYGLQCAPGRQYRGESLHQPHHQAGPDGRPPARRVVRPSTLERVLPASRLQPGVRRMRVRDQVPPGLAGPGSEQDVAHVLLRGIRG